MNERICQRSFAERHLQFPAPEKNRLIFRITSLFINRHHIMKTTCQLKATASLELAQGLCVQSEVDTQTHNLRVVGVLGQNCSGQNGMDKMVWTKWYGQNCTNRII